MRPRLLTYCRRAPWIDAIEIVFESLGPGGEPLGVALPLTFHKVDPRLSIVEATTSLRVEDAQRLMDELWNCGLRPSEGSGSAGMLAATERHLADMRANHERLLTFVLRDKP